MPDSIERGNRHFLESLVYENDNHDVGKTGFQVTSIRKSKGSFRKQQPRSARKVVILAEQGKRYLSSALWIRPAYYGFLHRLHPF